MVVGWAEAHPVVLLLVLALVQPLVRLDGGEDTGHEDQPEGEDLDATVEDTESSVGCRGVQPNAEQGSETDRCHEGEQTDHAEEQELADEVPVELEIRADIALALDLLALQHLDLLLHREALFGAELLEPRVLLDVGPELVDELGVVDSDDIDGNRLEDRVPVNVSDCGGGGCSCGHDMLLFPLGLVCERLHTQVTLLCLCAFPQLHPRGSGAVRQRTI